jgi:hypothetical protein
MEIRGKKVMVLGGYGEVGYSISYRLLQERPRELIVTSLTKEEASAAVEKLRFEATNRCLLTPVYGNLFVRWSLKDIPREEILATPQYQQWLAQDSLEELTEEILTSSTIYRVISEHCPEIIVDCINTATALAYQNVYQSYNEISNAIQKAQYVKDLTDAIYRLLSTLCVPSLIRHIQILYEAMRRKGTPLYLKVGTTGTGGMGLNIPFTHGEEQPSRLLLSKAAAAGVQTLLLLLLSRTTGGPIIKELKPAALIGWKDIGKGRILKSGYPIPVYDCSPMTGYRLTMGESFCCEGIKIGLRMEGREVEGTYVNTGENGLFSLDEFKVVTALGLMQYITPEEIAETAFLEIQGVNTSKDVLGAITGAVMGPTYRAGFLRQRVIKEMESLGQEGIAYGLLGPRAAKLIFEANLIKRCYSTLEDSLKPLPVEMSYTLEREIGKDQEVRSQIISIGIPILLPDGETLLFASRKYQDKGWEKGSWFINPEYIEKWAYREWIDLRPQNMFQWQKHFQIILQESEKSSLDTSSRFDRAGQFWSRDEVGKIIIDPGELVGWILIREDGGVK